MMIGSMAIGSAALRIATSVFLFSARIRFPAHNSIVGTLWKRYGQDLVWEVRALEKLHFKYRKALLDISFLIPYRNYNHLPYKFLYFKISNRQLRLSAVYITCQKHLLNREILNKQKAVKPLQPMVATI